MKYCQLKQTSVIPQGFKSAKSEYYTKCVDKEKPKSMDKKKKWLLSGYVCVYIYIYIYIYTYASTYTVYSVEDNVMYKILYTLFYFQVYH